jgi:hypothetical protein
MKFQFLALLAASSLFATSPTEEFAIRDVADSEGNISTFYVTAAIVAETPEWSFDGTTQPPLSAIEAYLKARAWLQAKVMNGGKYELEDCSLLQIIHFDAPKRWYYAFTFEGPFNPLSRTGPQCAVLVLMDGTIIEPRRT